MIFKEKARKDKVFCYQQDVIKFKSFIFLIIPKCNSIYKPYKKRVYLINLSTYFTFHLINSIMAQPILTSPSTAQPIVDTASIITSTASKLPNNTTAQTISAAAETLISATEQSSGMGALIPTVIGLIVLAIVLYLFLGKRKSGNQNVIALIGERYSGKTQLFIRLNGGKIFETVPSIRNNHTSFKMASSRKTYQMSDFCGDGISKDQILHQQNYSTLHTLIHVVDGTDPTKLGDAGLFMYRLLVNKSYQKRECNYVLLLNKSDSENFLTRAKLVKRLEDEIEHIKQSRKNSPQESEQEEDYLKATKERFNLEKSGIRVVVGAVRNGQIKDLQSVLEDIL